MFEGLVPSSATHWQHGFDPVEAAAKGERLFNISVCFPGLRREYLPLISRIGSLVGSVLESEQTTATTVVARATGLPSVRVLVADVSSLPKVV